MKYDRFIFSEDDNEFSPNFLEFLDKNLEKYNSDKSIYAVSGYCWSVKKRSEKTVRQNVALGVYGYGTWKDRIKRRSDFTYNNVREYLKKYSNVHKLYKMNTHYFVDAVEIALKKHYLAFEGDSLIFIDIVQMQYVIINQMYVISPMLSKARNNGFDGSGLHCGVNTNKNVYKYNIKHQDIDKRKDYEITDYIEMDEEYYKNSKSMVRFKIIPVVKAWIKWLFFIRVKK